MKQTKDEPRKTAGLVVLLIMGGFGVMGGGLLAPALPALMEPFGVEQGSVGLVLGVYTFAAAVSLPFTGLFIDFWGRRFMGITCLLIDGVFGLLCLWAPTFSVLLVLRFIQGIGIAGLIPVAMTVISDWYSGEARLNVMGYLSSAISMSAVVIPLVGGILAGLSWQYPFMVYGLSLILALLYFIFIDESRPDRQMENLMSEAKSHIRKLEKALHLSEVQQVFAHCLVLYFSLYAVVTFLPLLLAHIFSLHGPEAGIALSVQGLVAAVVAWQATRLKKMTSPRGLLVCGFGLLSAAAATIPLWSNQYLMIVSLILFGLGMGTLQPHVYNSATTAAPEELTGSIVSLFNTVKFIGMTLAPVLLGIVHRWWSIAGVFWMVGIITMLWAARNLLQKRCTAAD